MPEVTAISSCASWDVVLRSIVRHIRRTTVLDVAPHSTATRRGVSDPRWPRVGWQLHTDTGVAHARFPSTIWARPQADGTERRPVAIETASGNPRSSMCWFHGRRPLFRSSEVLAAAR